MRAVFLHKNQSPHPLPHPGNRTHCLGEACPQQECSRDSWLCWLHWPCPLTGMSTPRVTSLAPPMGKMGVVLTADPALPWAGLGRQARRPADTASTITTVGHPELARRGNSCSQPPPQNSRESPHSGWASGLAMSLALLTVHSWAAFQTQPSQKEPSPFHSPALSSP